MMRLLLAVFFLLALPSISWADSSPLWVTPGAEDKSVQYLGFVFGVVNGLLHGSGSQIMGQMFQKFNSGILVLAGFVVFYTTILGLLSSAQEGEFLGKKYSSFFVPLRTALGIILIAPTATGYSWIQVIVMWMVLQGVGAANMVWQAALGYLQNGGAVIVQNQSQTNNGAYAIRGVMPNMMASVTCLQLMQHAIDQAALSQNAPIHIPTVSAMETVTNKFVVIGSDTSLADNATASVPMPNFSQDTDPDWTELNGKCGIVSFQKSAAVAMTQVVSDLAASAPAVTDTCRAGCWPHKQQVDNPNIPKPDRSYCDDGTYVYDGAVSCVGGDASCTLFGLSGAGSGASSVPQKGNMPQLFADGQTSGTPMYSWCNTVDLSQPNVAATFNNAVMDYLGLTYSSTEKSSYSAQQLNDMISDQGTSWFSAGTFYFALVAQNEAAQQADAHVPFAVSYGSHPALGLTKTDLEFTKPKLAASSQIFQMWLLPFFDQGNNALTTAFANGQAEPHDFGHSRVSSDSPTDPTGGGGIGQIILNALLPGVAGMIHSFIALTQDQHNNANPVVLMMMFGSGMLGTAMVLWFGIAGVLFTIVFGLGSLPCVTLSNSVNPVMQVIGPFLTIILVPMFVSGCMLLFYLPAVPFMIFTFGAIGWIIGVIEAMVAAPVVGFAIMSPEGNDIFGKGDPAVMIMLNVFLRPSLMIFGLIAGIMVSYIGIWMVNDGYTSILGTIAFAGGSFSSLLVGLLAVPMVYMIICMQVINRSFTLIHVLPDKVTRWLAGGNVEQLGSEMAGAEKDAKSATQGGFQSAGKGFAKASEGNDKRKADNAKNAQGKGKDELGGDK